MNESRNGANFGPPNDQNIKDLQGFIRVFAILGAEFDPGMSEYQENARFHKGFGAFRGAVFHVFGALRAPNIKKRKVL